MKLHFLRDIERLFYLFLQIWYFFITAHKDFCPCCLEVEDNIKFASQNFPLPSVFIYSFCVGTAEDDLPTSRNWEEKTGYWLVHVFKMHFLQYFDLR